MTVEAMSGLPLQAGSAVAAAAGRTALWAASWYMQQPLRNTAVAALIGLSAMAGSNALYHQAHHHPAPLFGTFESAPAAKPRKAAAPVMPAARPKAMDLVDSNETTGSVDPAAIAPQALGNADVIVVQQHLAAMNLFAGTVDGLFGPRTSKAIRAFEQQSGQPVKGQLTPQIVAMIKAAPALSAAPVAPAVDATPVVQAAPPIVAQDPLPAPAPLLSASPAQPEVQVAEIAPVATTTESDAATETLPMTTVPTRTVQTIAVHAQVAPQVVEQAMPSAIEPEDATTNADADAPPAIETNVATDKTVVASVQRGLNSLGFLHGEISGLADEATAKAIRNFEVYYNYAVTGKVSRGLVNLLQQAGAVI